MVIYLTSDPIVRAEGRLQNTNGFSELFLQELKSPCSALYICADPNAAKENDAYANLLFSCLEEAGVTFSHKAILDERNQAEAESLVQTADLIVLGDGDVCTEYAFFEEIGLGTLLIGYDGVLLGIGSGSTNAAVDIFVQPGEAGTATDLFYEKHLYGLSLVRVSLVPHYRVDANTTAAKDIYTFERITYRDEMTHDLFAIPDGSFFLCENGISVLFGEGYLIEDDRALRCCRENECYRLD